MKFFALLFVSITTIIGHVWCQSEYHYPESFQPDFRSNTAGGRASPLRGYGGRQNYPQPRQTTSDTLVAQVHGSGVYGYVTFKGESNGETKIVAHVLGGLKDELYALRIFQLPPQIGAACSPLSLGGLMYDISEREKVYLKSGFETSINARLNTKGPNSLLGRTLQLHGLNSGSQICAIILATDTTMYQGKLHHPLSGMVYMFHSRQSMVIGTEWLMYSDGQRRDTYHTWALAEGLNADSTTDRKYRNELERCSQFRGDIVFSSRDQSGPQIPVSTEDPVQKGRMQYPLPNLGDIDRAPSIYFIIYDSERPSQILACVPLNRVEPKTVIARLNSTEISGQIKLVQRNPYEPTEVSVNLRMSHPAYAYGLDVLPSIRRRRNEAKKCPNIKETIYNPFHIDPAWVPEPNMGTTDQYATGDLSGKYGNLSQLREESFNTYDFNLPLFGYYSVVGRAVVVYAPDGPAIACSNLDLEGRDLTTAYATFDVPLQGQFIMRQAAGECSSDTYIYIEISRPEGNGINKTVNHKWHVHQAPAPAGTESLSSTECSSVGGHLNPYNVSTSCIYQRDCSIFTPVRCELGDESGKLGVIDIPPYRNSQKSDPQVSKYYFIDSDMPVCGPFSAIGRALVIHDSDFRSSIVACSNIIEFKPKQ